MHEGKMKKDIENRDDIILLVDTFYTKVKSNPVIGFIFEDVAQINWEKHLPVMYSFWSGILLTDHSYSGNPMIKHIELSRKTEMSEKQFNEWLTLFNQTVDELFTGSKANEAKTRANTIANLMLTKINLHK